MIKISPTYKPDELMAAIKELAIVMAQDNNPNKILIELYNRGWRLVKVKE